MATESGDAKLFGNFIKVIELVVAQAPYVRAQVSYVPARWNICIVRSDML
jgi:hypothetical protein